MGIEGQVQDLFLPLIQSLEQDTRWPIWIIDEGVAALERRGWKGEPVTYRLGPGQ